MARDYNLISEAEKLELGDILGSSQDQQKLGKHSKSNQYSRHFPHFVVIISTQAILIKLPTKSGICVIHVGKCVTVIESLKNPS